MGLMLLFLIPKFIEDGVIMCGFMYLSKQIELEKFKDGFEKIAYRGPDESKIIETTQGILGFHRLAIIDTKGGMQPFTSGKTIVVCNGEIFNYKELKEEYHFDYKTESDCEVLIPLFQKYGKSMFSILDGEYAFVIEYDQSILAARDPFGIRPMFYGYIDNKICFASEAKALHEVCENIKPFPPGYVYHDGQFECFFDVSKSTDVISCRERITEGINDKLTAAVVKRMHSDRQVGYLLSGGLDSSLVCSIASKHSKQPIKTFAIGMEEDAIDLKYAKQVADYIKSDHHEVIITKEDVLSSVEELIVILETYDITTIRASIGMYLVCKYIKSKTDVRVLLTGEVSDELFGYKYTDFAPSALAFQEEAEKRVSELYMYDVLRADRCIASNSLEARVPFGDISFSQFVMNIDPSLKMNNYGKGKYLLRKAFEFGYLPEDIVWREKAAFSDAVGHSLVDCIKDYCETLYQDNYLKESKRKYPSHTPFTKESFYYREIFEKYYPGCEGWINGFWMPNKDWEGCDVSDPSARVLSNYGDSAK